MTVLRGENMTKILVATRNAGKLREYAEMLSGLNVDWLMLSDLGIDTEVEETGSTFEENARLKAVAYAQESGLPTLADDSGLEVDALDGAPGIYSARYGEPGLDDQGRYQRLLKDLDGVPPEQRSARFRCVVAICTPGGDIHTAAGACEGQIAFEPKGTHGFGYDPVFQVTELGKRMAELEPQIKNQISHRARALEAIRPTLTRLLNR